MPIKIIDLTTEEKETQEEHIQQIAEWYYKEWGHLANKDLAQFKNDITTAIQEKQAYQFIAIDTDKNELVGCLSLKLKNMEDEYPNANWGPWLSGLYVKENYRKQKISPMLGKAVAEKAIELGKDNLFYFTHDPQLLHFYHRLGGETIMPAIGDSYFYHEKPILLFKSASNKVLKKLNEYLENNVAAEEKTTKTQSYCK